MGIRLGGGHAELVRAGDSEKTEVESWQRTGSSGCGSARELGRAAYLAATPALAAVRQWRRPAAAAFRAGCARGSSPAEDARRAPAGREAL